MITGQTPAAAARALRDVLQRAVSCVSAGVLIEIPRGVARELLLTSRLARSQGGERLVLNVQHRYSLIHRDSGGAPAIWTAQTAEYYYTLEGADDHEIIAYHWHPAGRSHVTTPHLHLGAGAGTLRRELTKAHLATGVVTPSALLALVIEQFGVRPRRADWAAVLRRAREAMQPS